MSNLFGNLSRSNSNGNMSRMEHDLKMLDKILQNLKIN